MTQRFKRLLRAIDIALGVTTIYLFWLLGPLVTSTRDAIFHWDGSPSQLFAAPILDFCAFWLVLALLLIFARGKLRIAIWCVIIALMPWVDIKNWGYLSRTSIPHWLSLLTLVLVLSVFRFCWCCGDRISERNLNGLNKLRPRCLSSRPATGS